MEHPFTLPSESFSLLIFAVLTHTKFILLFQFINEEGNVRDVNDSHTCSRSGRRSECSADCFFVYLKCFLWKKTIMVYIICSEQWNILHFIKFIKMMAYRLKVCFSYPIGKKKKILFESMYLTQLCKFYAYYKKKVFASGVEK